MGTRWEAFFFEGDKHIATVYGQYDGYCGGAGAELKTIMNNGEAKILNGFGMGEVIPTHFNGMGCLSAYVIGKLKGDKIGGISMSAAKDPLLFESWTEYAYVFTAEARTDMMDRLGTPINVKIISKYRGVIYDGLLEDCDMDTVEDEPEDEEEEVVEPVYEPVETLEERIGRILGSISEADKKLLNQLMLMELMNNSPVLGGDRADD
jgi:hypothetical protein